MSRADGWAVTPVLRLRLHSGRPAPYWLISAQLAIAAYQRTGGPTAQTTDTVERLLGRPARGFGDFAQEHAERFRG